MNNTPRLLTHRLVRELVLLAALVAAIFIPGVLAFGRGVPPASPEVSGLLDTGGR